MLVETISMWTDRRTLVNLRDVLMRFQPNDWRWRVEEFEGVGRFPAGVTWAEFDADVEAGAAVFDWDGIQQFADGLDQMINGRIVATDADGTIMATIEALDSTEYEIAINPV
ncbi:hypothetical protein ACFV4K_18090 [Nocardia sp. NPDC059764]|uniref:hypothetical protein n=1 Tax=Nocardia sp. NPDC059764 TaxID=3346939 RepID=UPI003661F96B